MYKDAGSLYLRGISIGGNQNLADDSALGGNANNTDMLDNIRMNIDIAGAAGTNNTLHRGLADFYGAEGLAALALEYGAVDIGNTLTDLKAAELTQAEVNGINPAALSPYFVKGRVAIEDGDLLIHEIATDPLAALMSADDLILGGNAALATTPLPLIIKAATEAVDFKLEIAEIGIADSSYKPGTAATTTAVSTTLISGLSIKGYLGHKDIHIENNGNGFGAADTDGNGRISQAEAAGSLGYGDANSKIHMDSYFRVTDLDVYIDIAGVQINDLKIHNSRGDHSGLDGLSSFGFAHSMRDIYAVKDTVLNIASLPLAPGTPVTPAGTNTAGFVDGIAINTVSKFDLDIGSLSFGDTGTSIGEIYLTDVINTTNWTISAH